MMEKAVLRRILAGVLLCIMLVIPVSATEGSQEIAIEQGCHSADARWSILGDEQLINNCTTAMLYELNSDTLMYAWNPDAPIYPASLVKIMTALVVVEKGSLSDAVTVRQSVLDTVDSNAVSVDLKADEVLTVEDLLYCMMVYSANDAAAVLADHIAGGNQEKFVEEMNRYAQELGCTSTKFVNVHGLHHSDQVTTARDVIKILTHASENELFMQFFGAAEYVVPETNKTGNRDLSTGNYLISRSEGQIYNDERVIGSRTGTTAMGERCIASIAQDGDMKLLCLISGVDGEYIEDGYKGKSISGFPETTLLLNYGFDGYRPVQLMYKDQSLEQCKVQGAANDVVLGVSSDISTVLPVEMGLNDIRFQYSDGYNQLTAPIKKGQVVGSVSLWNGNICVGACDLYAMSDVSDDGPKIEQKSKKAITVGKVILITAVVLVAAFGALLCVRWVHTIRVMKQRRRRRRGHRRSR